MKSGASDPFADDEQEDGSAAEETPEAAGTEEAAADANVEGSESGDSAGSEADGSGATNATDAPLELPYIYRRDKVKDERPDVHQLFVRDDTDTRARDAERDLEKLLGEDVYRLDAREAIYLAGMRHLDEAADVLREWGYDR